MKDQRDLPSEFLEPARIARLVLIAYRRGWCDGVFITSGVARSAVWAMEKTLELVEMLRITLGYRGYLHVKAVEGAEPGQIERLVRLVDRVSYQMEPACIEASETASGKAIAARDSFQRVSGARSSLRPARHSAGRSESGSGLARYRSRQASLLVRDYGFSADELVFDREGRLPLEFDPKLEWALAHPERFPVELKTACREELQRIPGFGPRSVQWILTARAKGRLSGKDDLAPLGAALSRGAAFVTLEGRLVGFQRPQPLLFSEMSSEKMPERKLRTETRSPLRTNNFQPLERMNSVLAAD